MAPAPEEAHAQNVGIPAISVLSAPFHALHRSPAATRRRLSECVCLSNASARADPRRSNPNVSEEAKENSRRKLEEIEGTSDPDAFTASTQSANKSQNYDPDQAAYALDE